MVLYMSSQREIQKQNKISCETAKNAGVAQLVEQLICNQQVGGSSPSTSSNMGEFPSGQRGQTVNLLRHASMVRIHLLPPAKTDMFNMSVFLYILLYLHTN